MRGRKWQRLYIRSGTGEYLGFGSDWQPTTKHTNGLADA